MARGLYLIEILHQTTTFVFPTRRGILLYLIEILHQTTTYALHGKLSDSLYLIEILHQTTTMADANTQAKSCILSKFYIKPQPSFRWLWRYLVVSYRNSTSNHNCLCGRSASDRLYLIEILHQTTTSGLILIDKVLLTGCLPL